MKAKTVTSVTFILILCWFALMLVISKLALQEAFPEPQSSEPKIIQVPGMEAVPVTDTVTGTTFFIYR